VNCDFSYKHNFIYNSNLQTEQKLFNTIDTETKSINQKSVVSAKKT